MVELYHWWRGGDMNMIIMNKLVEQERFIDSVTVERLLKDNFLIKGFMAFCVSLV